MGIKWYFIMVLICIPVMTIDAENLDTYCLTFKYLLAVFSDISLLLISI